MIAAALREGRRWESKLEKLRVQWGVSIKTAAMKRGARHALQMNGNADPSAPSLLNKLSSSAGRVPSSA